MFFFRYFGFVIDLIVVLFVGFLFFFILVKILIKIIFIGEISWVLFIILNEFDRRVKNIKCYWFWLVFRIKGMDMLI